MKLRDQGTKGLRDEGTERPRDEAAPRTTHHAPRTTHHASRITYHASRLPPPAFSLIEVLVTVALLTLIILGLFTMFAQVQKAFRASLNQGDVLEGGRSTMETLVREIEQTSPCYRSNLPNFYAIIPFSEPLLQSLPGGSDPANPAQRTNIIEDLFFLRRENQTWYGTGYFVRTPDPVTGLLRLPETQIGSPGKMGAGTLYRFSTNTTGIYQDPAELFAAFQRARQQDSINYTNVNRIAEGVVHFRFRAFDTNGALIITNIPHPYLLNTDIRYSTVVPGQIGLLSFSSNAVPAGVEIELAMLEEANWQRFKAIPSSDAQHNYLSNHVGQVHLFRRRVPIPSVDFKAYAYQ